MRARLARWRAASRARDLARLARQAPASAWVQSFGTREELAAALLRGERPPPPTGRP